MATIAVYNLKGGVGKTTFAVNLAWSAAAQAGRSTLLWDLDPQAAASWLLCADAAGKHDARSVFARDTGATKLIRSTATPGLDILAADKSLRALDQFLFTLGKRKRLSRLIEGLDDAYERVILDCPPGLSETTEQVVRAADLIIVPVIPSPLSARALNEVVTHLRETHGGHAPILPVFSMVDRRRSLHRAALGEYPDWPTIPMASAVEQMSVFREPVGGFAPRSPAADAFAGLWRAIDKRLKQARGGNRSRS